MIVLLGVLACGLIYHCKTGGSEAKHAVSSNHSEPEPEAVDQPAVPAEPQGQPHPQAQAQVQPRAQAPSNTQAAADSAVDADIPASLVQRIRDSLVSDPKLAEKLIREAPPPDPDSSEADELDALLVAAIFNQHDIYRARLEARHYFRSHPGGRYTEYLMTQTKMHPPPPGNSNPRPLS